MKRYETRPCMICGKNLKGSFGVASHRSKHRREREKSELSVKGKGKEGI